MLENSLQFLPSFKSSLHEEEFGFSMGFKQETSSPGRTGDSEHTTSSKEDSGNCEELDSERQHTELESKSKGNEPKNERQHPGLEPKSKGDEPEGERQQSGLESKSEGDEFGLMNKSKKKRNRRKLRKRIRNKEKSFKIIGVNVAGLMSKFESFKKLLRDKDPSVSAFRKPSSINPTK